MQVAALTYHILSLVIVRSINSHTNHIHRVRERQQHACHLESSLYCISIQLFKQLVVADTVLRSDSEVVLLYS